MIPPCWKRTWEVAVFIVKRSMALLMTSGMRSWRKSTRSRLVSPNISGQRFRTKYCFRGRKFLNVWLKGMKDLFMGKDYWNKVWNVNWQVPLWETASETLSSNISSFHVGGMIRNNYVEWKKLHVYPIPKQKGRLCLPFCLSIAWTKTPKFVLSI